MQLHAAAYVCMRIRSYLHTRSFGYIQLHPQVAIHLAHSTEQMGLLADTVVELMEWWELEGLPQQGKYTTKQLREAHLTYPWLTFSIGTYDGMHTSCHDLPLILPSNQCQESWHKGLMKVLKGQLRGSTDHVLTNSLPRVLLDDTINMPRQLCFEPVNVNVCRFMPTPCTRPASHTACTLAYAI